MQPSSKELAYPLLDQVSEPAGWEDLMDPIRQPVEAGLADIQADRTPAVKQLREDLGTEPLQPR